MTKRFQVPLFTSLIIRKDDKILLLKRSKHKICGGLYAFPGGGVDGNEPVTVATIREAQEEVGIVVDFVDLQCKHVMHFTRKNDVEYINFFFEVSRWQGQLENKEVHNCDEIAWFDVHNLPENMLPSHRYVLNTMKDTMQFSEYGW